MLGRRVDGLEAAAMDRIQLGKKQQAAALSEVARAAGAKRRMLESSPPLLASVPRSFHRTVRSKFVAATRSH